MRHVVQIFEVELIISSPTHSKRITKTPIEIHTQAPNAWLEAGSVGMGESRFPQSRSCLTEDIVKFD
jgi:hypothetical protein